MTGPRDVADGLSITLHSSWRGIAFAVLGVVCLLGIAAAVVAANGFTVVSTLIVVAAIGASVVVLFDMPIATTFDAAGIIRSTPLRRHRIEWDDIDRLTRTRRGLVRRPGSPRSSGIVAMRGGRQILLVDRTEGREEHRRLKEAVGDVPAGLQLAGLEPPPANRTPTWTGRRAKWAPNRTGR